MIVDAAHGMSLCGSEGCRVHRHWRVGSCWSHPTRMGWIYPPAGDGTFSSLPISFIWTNIFLRLRILTCDLAISWPAGRTNSRPDRPVLLRFWQWRAIKKGSTERWDCPFPVLSFHQSHHMYNRTDIWRDHTTIWPPTIYDAFMIYTPFSFVVCCDIQTTLLHNLNLYHIPYCSMIPNRMFCYPLIGSYPHTNSASCIPTYIIGCKMLLVIILTMQIAYMENKIQTMWWLPLSLSFGCQKLMNMFAWTIVIVLDGNKPPFFWSIS